MVRKILSLACVLLGLSSLQAQDWPDASMLTPMPLNPKVKSGVLPNGLSYYILHNEEPKGKANFYIAQKVGSTLEEPTQLGLAHFLEHMAFNGTTNYPGKSMLNYLQNKGIRFGADINAYTYYDETVYNINNVTTSDKNLMDSVLLVLHDWSNGILLEESEIDAERGVIREELRMREDANERMRKSVFPKIYKEFPYQHSVGGDVEIIMNFKPEVIRDYYKKWYRPDQQGIIIVGDFDADEMEKKVKDLFSTIEMPKNAPKRTYTPVSDNKEPIYVFFDDPEMNQVRTTVSFKSEVVPFELRNTVEMYAGDWMIKELITNLFNNRLDEVALEPDCDYSYAGVYFGDFYVSKVKDSFNIVAIAKKDALSSVADAMSVVTRACKTGFTESEYFRVKDEILANLEKQYNERDKTDNEALARELCRHFIDNDPVPGIEMEYMLWQQMLPMMPLEAINAACGELLTSDNMVIVTAQPKGDNFEIVTQEAMLKTVNDAMNAQYEAYVDEVVTEPLIAELPKPGTIKNMTEDSALGTVTYNLSNGVKVILKPTDFSADEVLLTAYREGGKQIYSADQANNVLMMEDVFENAKMGPFNTKMLQKYLSGKKVSLSLSINSYTDVLRGSSTVKDLPTLMELIYTAFTNLNPDIDAYNVNIERYKPILKNMESNPQYIFGRAVAETTYGGNPLVMPASLAVLENAVYDESLELIHSVLKNAAEYTFIFTGNVDNATIRPLLEQYIATLPVGLRKKMNVVTPVDVAKGQVTNDFKQPMQTPSTFINNQFTGYNLPYTLENSIMVSLLGSILQNVYTETLREDEGGTYSPFAYAYYNPNSGSWNIIYQVQTNADMQQKMIDRANVEFDNLLSNGADAAQFNKVKEAAVKQFENNIRNNQFWDSQLMAQTRFPQTPIITGYEETLNGINLEQFNNFLKNINPNENRVQVIMEGIAAE